MYQKPTPLNPLKLTHLVGLCLVTLGGIAHAQLPDAGSLLRDIENLPRSFEPTPPLGSQLPPALPDTGQTITLNSVRFENFSPMATEAELQALVKNAIGQQLGFNGLMRLADRVTEHLKNKGYLLAFAYLPEQDISSGDLLIRIQPGRIEGGQLNRDNLDTQIENSTTLTRILATINTQLNAEDTDILRARQMERGLLLINDLAGINASSSLERGREFGTTRVNLAVNATPRHTANAWVDNYGSFFTGDWRVNGLGYVNNIMGHGDQLSALLTRSEFLSYGRIGYSRPIGYRGLSTSAAVSLLNYELGNTNIDAQGSALTLNSEIRYALIRSRKTNLYTSINYEHKRLKDEINQSPDKDRVYNNLNVRINGDNLDQLGGGGLTNYSITYTVGDLDRSGNAADLLRDQVTAQTQGRFSKLSLSGARIQKLSNSVTLFVSANAQTMASNNLDSAETISISGISGVRAYAGGDASGDEGWRLTIEPRYDIPGLLLLNGGIQLAAFYDIGRITHIDKNPFAEPANTAGVNAYTISGAGLGVTWSKPQQFNVRASYAWKINDTIDERSTVNTDSEGKDSNGRFWLQAMVWF